MIAAKTIVLAAAVIVACSTASARAEILIGFATAMTGKHAWFGEMTQTALDVAAAELNARGGVLGEPVRVIGADDNCQAEQAVAAARKLVSESVVFVVGHTCSDASMAAWKVYEEARVVMMTASSTNPRLTDEGGPSVFRLTGRDDQQGQIAGDYLADHWPKKRIAIIHDGHLYGRGLAAEAKAQLNRRGVREAIFETIEPDQADHSTLVERLQASGIEVVYFGGYHSDFALIIRQSHDRGYSPEFLSGDSISTEDFWLIAGQGAEGVMFTFPPSPASTVAAAPVIDIFKAHGQEPTGYMFNKYAAVQAWAQAVETAGTMAYEAVIDTLQSQKFETVLGTITFDEKGDATGYEAFAWHVWKDGAYLPLEQVDLTD